MPAETESGLELTAGGSLWLTAALAARHFPHDLLVPLRRGRELWLLPTRGAGGGGLILKQRNRAGDRSVLAWEVLPPGLPPGPLAAFWDAENGALRVALPLRSTADGSSTGDASAPNSSPAGTGAVRPPIRTPSPETETRNGA